MGRAYSVNGTKNGTTRYTKRMRLDCEGPDFEQKKEAD